MYHRLTFGVHRQDSRVRAVEIECETDMAGHLIQITSATRIGDDGTILGPDADEDPTWRQIQARLDADLPRG